MSNRTNRLPRAPQFGMTRRELWPSIGCGVLLAGSSVCVRAAAAASPVAETAYGHVRGGTVQGVHIFRGIPYGGPTEGAGRFMPPSKPAKWAGSATPPSPDPAAFRAPGTSFCPRLSANTSVAAGPTGSRLPSKPIAKTAWTSTCSPQACAASGPSWSTSTAAASLADRDLLTLFGDRFVREQDVVLVGVNHRLNVFGYTWLGGLSSEVRRPATSGNSIWSPRSNGCGTTSRISAEIRERHDLRRIGRRAENQRPDGHASGQRPVPQSLLFRVAASCAPARRKTAPKRPEHPSNLGLNENQVDELQNVPAEKLFAAARGRGTCATSWSTAIRIPHQTWDPKAPEESAEIPLLVGNDKDESSLVFIKGRIALQLG